jgi:16S rRNA (guanine(966)-N(2))-methyltransferase RsmD
MRVTTGTARGRNLAAPDGLSTRPTSGLVKEAVFSIIQFEIAGSAVLDLFAGSGQMGVEALSRGARSCEFVDNAKASRVIIEQNLRSTGLAENARVHQAEAITFLQGPQILNRKFDIIFLDPPYGQNLPQKALPLAGKAVSERGVIICESNIKEELPQFAGELPKHREYRYGKTKITVYRHQEHEE